LKEEAGLVELLEGSGLELELDHLVVQRMMEEDQEESEALQRLQQPVRE